MTRLCWLSSDWVNQEPASTGAFPYADPWLSPRGDKGDRPGEDSPKGGKNV